MPTLGQVPVMESVHKPAGGGVRSKGASTYRSDVQTVSYDTGGWAPSSVLSTHQATLPTQRPPPTATMASRYPMPPHEHTYAASAPPLAPTHMSSSARYLHPRQMPSYAVPDKQPADSAAALRPEGSWISPPAVPQMNGPQAQTVEGQFPRAIDPSCTQSQESLACDIGQNPERLQSFNAEELPRLERQAHDPHLRSNIASLEVCNKHIYVFFIPEHLSLHDHVMP